MAIRAGVFRGQFGKVRVGGEHISADSPGKVNDDVTGEK